MSAYSTSTSESQRQTEKRREMLMHGECGNECGHTRKSFEVVVHGCKAMSANYSDEEWGAVSADNRNTGAWISECKKHGLKDRNWVKE